MERKVGHDITFTLGEKTFSLEYFNACFPLVESENSIAIEELKKQIEHIVQELNLLKEQQALQTGIVCVNKLPQKYHTGCYSFATWSDAQL